MRLLTPLLPGVDRATWQWIEGVDMEHCVSLVDRTWICWRSPISTLSRPMAASARPAARPAGPRRPWQDGVGELETLLGIRLVERTSRGILLTEAGVRLQARVGPLLAELAQAGEGVGTAGPPRGRLRVSAPTLLSDYALGPIAVSFARAYPKVSLEITAENRMAELPADGYDLVIRVDPAPQGAPGRPLRVA